MTKTTECPKGVPSGSLGENALCHSCNMNDILEALEDYDAMKEPREYAAWCSGIGIKPVLNPFWKFLPYTNIYQSITPDVLHQLHQGMTKHVISWLQSTFGTLELDSRCRCLPLNHNVRHFSKGFSGFSRISGKEHAEICKVLLGLIIGLPLPDNRSSGKLLCAVRGILDFLYLAQLPSHTDETLCDMTAALDAFHMNKSIFIELGIRDDFNFPKLHSLLHYTSSIRLFRTTDNYNTEHSERLHIDLAKDVYAATNRKDELAQMVTWLWRMEKITRFDDFIQWRLHGRLPPPSEISPGNHHTRIKIARNPTASITLDDICHNYGAKNFRSALAEFLAHHANPQASRSELRDTVLHPCPDFTRIPVFQKVKIWIEDSQGRSEVDDTLDVAHARCRSKARSGHKLPARFDTVLVDMSADGGPDEHGGVQGGSCMLCKSSSVSQRFWYRFLHRSSPSHF